MKDRQSITHVFDEHIICDDVTLKSWLKRFFQSRIGIENERVGQGEKKNMTSHPAFGIQETGFDRIGCCRIAAHPL